MPVSGRCDCEDPRAGADIEHALCLPPLRQIVKRQQAAACRTMMTGTEGEGGFNFDIDIVGVDHGATVGAMHDEATGADRLEFRKALRHPVDGGNRLDAERIRRGVSCRQLDEAAQCSLVRSAAEMDRHLPAAVMAFEGGTGRVLRIETVTEISGDTPRSRLIAAEAGNNGGRTHAMQVCPSHSRAQWLSRRL